MSDQEKTEAPSEKKRKEILEKGSLERNQFVFGGMEALGLLVATISLGSWIAYQVCTEATALWSAIGPIGVAPGLDVISKHVLDRVTVLVGVFLAFFSIYPLVGVLSNQGVLSVRKLRPQADKALKPSLERINLSPKRMIDELLMLSKVLIPAILSVSYVWWRREMLLLNVVSRYEFWAKLGKLVVELCLLYLVSTLILFAVQEVVNRRRNSESLKMSRQEKKDEHKNAERDATVVAEQRRRFRKLLSASRGRSDARGSEVDLVVTNPTHIAIGLLYAKGTGGAPRISFVGQGRRALRFIRRARELQVPVVEDKTLARQLLKWGLVGAEIPRATFSQTAKLYGRVLRLRTARLGNRGTELRKVYV